jgi:UDPglucose--hexose-1-phosphate uridylyltransferase
MPEFRQNLATKEWIIIAAERAKRPDELTRTRPPAGEIPAHSDACPFCPGPEGKTPPPVLTYPGREWGQDWCVRVVPNKFAALSPAGTDGCASCTSFVGPFVRRDGVGYHEVVIETPVHNCDLPLLPPAHMRHVLEAYRARFRELTADPAAELVVIFRNHGERAGTSLIHPHSQIVASSVVPFDVRNKLYEGQRYFDTWARCVYCDILEYELREGTRVVLQNEHFVVLAPYASGVPYEMLLLPRRHHPSFGSVEDNALQDMAAALQEILIRLWRLLRDPDYNYVIDTAPDHMADVPFYHWHLEIYPRLTTRAGFEIGSGIGINVVPPEDAAARLRDTNGAPITPGELEQQNGAG